MQCWEQRKAGSNCLGRKWKPCRSIAAISWETFFSFISLPRNMYHPTSQRQAPSFGVWQAKSFLCFPCSLKCSRSALRKHFYSKVKPWQKFNSRCAIAPKHRRWVGLTWHCIFDTSKIIKASCACVEMKPFLTNRGRHMCSRIIAT